MILMRVDEKIVALHRTPFTVVLKELVLDRYEVRMKIIVGI